MPFFVSDCDITACKADAIVNAANTELRMGGGVCGEIFRAAGAAEMEKACRESAPIRTGDAVLTPGFSLRARYVIHTAGPIWSGSQEDASLLYRCYQSALELAAERGLKTVVFPLISAGIYGCPKEIAERIARKSILDFLATHEEMTVTLILYGMSEQKKSLSRYASLCERLRAFTDKTKRKLVTAGEAAICALPPLRAETVSKTAEEVSAPIDTGDGARPKRVVPGIGAARDVDTEKAFLAKPAKEERPPVPEHTFSDILFRFIDEKGLTDPEVYKAANLDRRLFSKFRSKREYTPKKTTVLALAIALRLDIPQTEILLDGAGYSLSSHRQTDIIVRWFMEKQIYDIYEINDMLLAFHQRQLG